MLKKTITYTDFDGVQRTETFCFNLSKVELTELEYNTEGGFEQYLQRLIETVDKKEMMERFKWLIHTAYGVKSPDGKYFEKSKELSDAFSHTNAYVELFMELGTNDKAAAAFINGILPQDLVAAASS